MPGTEVSDLCTLEVDGGVGIISLNRPDQLNIVNLDLRDALIGAIDAVRDHPDVRAVVVRANGKHFSAGADLHEFGTAESIFEARRIRWDRDPWGPLWQLRQPTIAALHGIAVAAGLEMALLCDIRLAAPDTVVGLPETKLGMLPAAGGTQSLAKVVRPFAALPLVATADSLAADDALRRGVVHRVVDDVEAEALSMARHLASLPPAVVAAAKRALHASVELPLGQGLEAERRLASLAARRRPAHDHGG